MKKISIVPEIISSEFLEFMDENDIPVTICQKTPFKFINNFRPPSLIIDNFEKRKYKDIEIRTIDLGYLKNLGFRLVTVRTSSTIRNYQGQKRSYMIESPLSPQANSMILNNIPVDHYIEFDVTNNRIRLRGRNCYPYNKSEQASPWIQLKK